MNRAAQATTAATSILIDGTLVAEYGPPVKRPPANAPALDLEPARFGSPDQHAHIRPTMSFELEVGVLAPPERCLGKPLGGLGIAPGGGAELGRVEVIHRWFQPMHDHPACALGQVSKVA